MHCNVPSTDNMIYSELPLIQPCLDQKKLAEIMRWLDLRDTKLIQQHSKEIKIAGIGRKRHGHLLTVHVFVVFSCVCIYYSTITLMSKIA